MPELPEVETIRQDLRQKILGKKITRISIKHKKSVRNKTDIFINALKNNKFFEIDRIGKLMIFEIANKKLFMLAHLKMTGQLIYSYKKKIIAGGHSQGKKIELPNKHTRMIIEFSDKSSLFFNDLRKFGYLEIVDGKKLNEVKEKYGIEPNNFNFSIIKIKEIIKKRQSPIKAVLLNQKLIAGIGNIYADEILFAAKVRPDRIAKTLTDSEIKKIYEASNIIIKKAILHRGTTFNNYVDSEGKRGNFLKMLQVYGRKGLKCFRCNGIIKKIKVAGRGTHFCDCQY